MCAANSMPEAPETLSSQEIHHQLTKALANLEAVDATIQAAKTCLKSALTPGPGTAFKPASNAASHRRLHHPGRPRRIDADAELRAFVLARIEVMTFEALAEAIAQQFPPERCVGKSAIHDWFHSARR
ncbi:hypothetical protein [Phaeobacter sp. HF9A]|uniref:hypothetical protein n=1 Tax=Phaeobacter sp. HF9A TaxID=2721561 RepID=UPI001432085C|nr:hypothetical protein [Phaeobacter sp. HF9A]NIZ13842.1 hypothetical protein [Phaeobacter sp. HF9A]